MLTGLAEGLERRRSSVWRTRITDADGKLLALVTQTQTTFEAG